MIRPSRRAAFRLLTIALVSLVGLSAGARPAKAMTCHVEVKPILGVSPESSASLVVFNLAAPGEVRPWPCSGDIPSAPSASTHCVAVHPNPIRPGVATASQDRLPGEWPILYSYLSARARDRPPRV